MASQQELAALFGGGEQGVNMPPEISQAMGDVSGRISQLLANAGRGPSVGDVGRSLLMSAAYKGRVPYTQFLQEGQNQQYQTLGAQANLVSTAFQMHLEAAKAKAGSNPLAGFYASQMEQIQQEDPRWAQALYEGLATDQRSFSPELFNEYLQKTKPTERPTLVSQNVGDTEVSAFLDEQGNIVRSPLTGKDINTSPRYKSTTTIENNMPAPYPAAPSGYHYEVKDGKVTGLIRTPGGPPENTTESGRLAALDIAKQDVASAKNIIMPGGKVSRASILAGQTGTPWTEGRRAREAMRRSLDTLAKFKTGAAMNETEAQDYLDTYMPKLQDSDATIADKFQRFEQFIDQSFQRAGAESQLTDPNALPSSEDVDTMTDEEVKEWLKKLGK